MNVDLLCGDAVEMLRTLPASSVQCCVTSPPYYGLRDYGVGGQIGLEQTPEDYVERLVETFREVRRVLRDDGTLFLNLGDSYAAKPTGSCGFDDGRANRQSRNSAGIPEGYKPKDLIGIPWMVAFALRADGWFLRSAIVWHKPNPMPESVRDRPTSSYEMVFLLAKAQRYFYDAEAIAEPALQPEGDARLTAQHKQAAIGQNQTAPLGANYGAATRNARNVWTIATQPYSGAHFATMPPTLAERCVKAGSRPGDTVLDPFGGAGTTGLAALTLGRSAVLIDLNPAYVEIARKRLAPLSEMTEDIFG